MTENQTGAFALGDVLSITTGKWLSVDKGAGIGRLLTFIYGQQIPMAVVGMAADKAKGYLLSQHPHLKDVKTDYAKGEWEAWLQQMQKRLSETLEIKPFPAEDQREMDEWIQALPDGAKLIKMGS